MDHERRLAIEQRLQALEVEKCALQEELKDLTFKPVTAVPIITGNITQHASESEKIALFRSLFRGREDVFPHRWHNAKTGKSGYSPVCGNEWVKGICEKPKVKCGECPNQRFIPVSDAIIRNHLRGKDPNDKWGNDFIAGVYPLLAGDTCWFLAADFDKEHWQRDAAAFLATCVEHKISAALERSRSGNGGHVWIFFSEPVPVVDARALGTWLLTETMERHPDLGFSSYDRLFPNQNIMPLGGFGNLIALPLQYKPRQQGNSVFVDAQFNPYPDQWGFLSGLQRLSLAEVQAYVQQAAQGDRVMGVRLPITDEESTTPWKMTPSRQPRKIAIQEPLPSELTVVLGSQIFVPREGLPAPLIARMLRLAAFQNPEFYRAQAMRMPTFDKPRIIACAELFPLHLGLPRGCMDELRELLHEHKITLVIDDKRSTGKSLAVRFAGTLYPEQKAAVKALTAHDIGILAATTAFGKTVVAAQMIAKRKRSTLILVHRKQLQEQWRERLQTFLDVDAKIIGSIGGGNRKPTGKIDIALLQSLTRQQTVDDIVANYGHVIVDECHHLAAVSFEAIMRAAKAKYVFGLAALPAGSPRLLIATGRYIGEGFDAPELDTLFLALPISWKGTLAQYAGRLHRLHPDKTEVRVYDYRDSNINMLASMAEKRLVGYRAIGYEEGALI